MVRESNQLNFNLPKRVLLFLTKNIEDTRGVSRRVRHGHELEVSVLVSTLYSLITNLVHRGFAMGINGDAILMTFVRVVQVFFFFCRRRRECGLQRRWRWWWWAHQITHKQKHVEWLCRLGRNSVSFFNLVVATGYFLGSGTTGR